MRRSTLQTLLILAGLVLGIAVGQLMHALGAPPGSMWKDAGDLVLVRPLMLLIIPLVLVSVVVGVTSIGDPSRLGAIGGATLLYFVSTMLLAVIIGTSLVSTIRPGDGLSQAQVESIVREGERNIEQKQKDDAALREGMQEAQAEGLAGTWLKIVRQLVPTNVVAEMAAGRPLGIIVFAILLGLGLAVGGEKTRPAVVVFEALFEALLRLVGWVIWLAPLGVFLLVAHTVGQIGLGSLAGPIGKYMGTVTLGLAIHGLVVLPLVLAIVGRTNPWRFMHRMRRPLMTALGTSSSSATMPITLEAAVNEGGCSKRAANFVIPLGTTINMDGTALYEAVAVVFLFQLFGIDLSFSDLLIVVVTATLAAIGAAGIPSAGLITMVIVVTAVNTSLASRGVPELPLTAIGIVLGVDRVLDMFRTTVNVWGDMIGARVVTRLAP